MQDFSSKRLKNGFQLIGRQLAIDTLEKYQHIYKLLNYAYKEGAYLKVIPVKLQYTISKYAKSKAQMEKASSIDKFKIQDKFISIKTVGGLPIVVDSLKVIMDL